MLSEMTGPPWHSNSTTGMWMFRGHTASSSLCKAMISHSLQGLRQSLQGGQRDRFHLRDDALCAVAGHNLGDAPGESWIMQLLYSFDSSSRASQLRQQQKDEQGPTFGTMPFAPSPNTIWEMPPGAASTLEEGLSVRKLPTFWPSAPAAPKAIRLCSCTAVVLCGLLGCC